MNELDTFRAQKDDFFKSDYQSPLSAEQKRDFGGLKYFPEKPELRFELVPEPLPQPDQVEMQTSSGDVQVYHRHGRIRFQVEGQDAELTIYEGRFWNQRFQPVDRWTGNADRF